MSEAVETIVEEETIVVKKKRGRKPKGYIPTQEEIDAKNDKVKKKRGRKPKKKFNIETTVDNESILNLNTINHIIKIPVEAIEEINDNFELLEGGFTEGFTTDINNLNYNPNDFALYNDEQGFEQSLRELISNHITNIANPNPNKEHIMKYVSIIKKVVSEIETNTENIHFNVQQLVPEQKTVEDLQNNYVNENTNIYYNNKKQEFFNELYDDNLTQIEILFNKKYRHTKQISLLNNICKNINDDNWVQKTDIPCFRCCHTFENPPWGIPVKYENGVFQLSSIHCSPNCAMGDLLDTEKDNNILWQKVVLLNLLYHKVFGTDENIVPSPNKIALKFFGGPFDIREYRYLTLDNKKNYNITFPPCNIMAPILEETKKLTNQENYFIPIDMNNLQKINSGLKIKRRKVKEVSNPLFE